MQRASELQIQIDDVYACLGKCAGCVLSASERNTSTPDMLPHVLDLVESRLVEHARSCAPLERLNVTFGIADHLLLDPVWIDRIQDVGVNIIEAGAPRDTQHSAVFLTTSLVGKPDRLVTLMKRIAGRKREVATLPLVVLDPRLMRAAKFGPAWRDLVSEAAHLFGKVDLSINLSNEAVGLMEPSEFIAFAEVNGFEEVTVNWTPTLNNAPRTLQDIGRIRDWLIAFDEIVKARPSLGTSFRPVILRTINSVMCGGEGEDPGARRVVAEIIPETVRKSIEIDDRGYVLPKFEAVGDITHAARHGLTPLGHISDGTIQQIIDRGMALVKSRILAIHSKGACATCPVQGICAGTGFHVATNVARKTLSAIDEGDCPHVARALIERLLNEARAEDALRAA